MRLSPALIDEITGKVEIFALAQRMIELDQRKLDLLMPAIAAPLIGTGPAILSAIYDAIGTPIRELPATPERVWKALELARAA